MESTYLAAKRPRSEYEYDDHLLIGRHGHHDPVLSGTSTYATRRWEDPRIAEKGATNPVGVRSSRESREQYAPLAPYNYDDYRSELPIRGSDNDYVAADAPNTLFVEGIPDDCSRREAAHIFRHFQGFKEIRIVNKSKESANQVEGEASVNLVLCFVDFENPKRAAAAMEALQGYRFSKNDRESPSLKLRYAYPPRNRSRNRNVSSFARSNDRSPRSKFRRRSF